MVLCARVVVLALVGCSVAGSLAAQTTGTVVGRVAAAGMEALPGVVVEATSTALQGSRSTTSDEAGRYRLSLLPPGSYTVSFTLAGYRTERREGVVVGLDRESALAMTLQPETAEVITVLATVPAVDTTSTSLGANISQIEIQGLPVGRNYAAVVQIAPGVQSDAHPDNTEQSTITVYGSTGAENSYIIDGVNTTGVEYGFQGKELNFEFIQEVDVKTGGYEAEYGRSTGGIVNVITKSGGNTFHGDLFAYYDDDSLRSSAETIVSTAGRVDGFTRQDFGADLGGFLVRDKVWFFLAYDQVSNTLDSELPAGPDAGEIVRSESDRDLGAAKLTWNVSSGQSLVLSVFQDPRDDAGAINDASHTLNGEPLTYLGVREFGGRDVAVRYEGLLGSSWLLGAQVSRHDEENSTGPASEAGDVVQFRDVAADFFQRGGFGLIQQKDFQRDLYGVSAAWLASTHEAKVGIDYEDQSAEVVRRMSGGQQVDIFPNEVNPDQPIYRHTYWTTPTATVGNAPLSALVASPEHQNTTVYAQDRWNPRHDLTVSYGLRWDRQEIVDAGGTRQIDLKDVAPRLGVAWNPGATGRSKVFASFGRFYEQLPMDLVIRSFSFERQPRIVNYDPLSTTPNANAEADLGLESAILGGFTEPSDPNLEGQYVEEVILGYEQEVATGLAVGIKGVWREYGQVIEDFLCADDGTYCIGNPGEGIMESIYTYDYSRTLPAPEADRTFKGVQLDARKQFGDGWQALASYVFSKLDGNFDGLYAPFTNVGPDPNITAAYDYFDFFTDGRDLTKITNQGPLSNDRRHQFKVSGVYQTKVGLSVGLSAYYRTGTPMTRYGFSDGYGRYEFFLSERGAEGRTPDVYEADLHLGYPLEVGDVTINFLLDIFNLLDAQRPILLDQRWGFQESDNASPTPVNPNYHQPVLRTPPTSLRLGVRLSF